MGAVGKSIRLFGFLLCDEVYLRLTAFTLLQNIVNCMIQKRPESLPDADHISQIDTEIRIPSSFCIFQPLLLNRGPGLETQGFRTGFNDRLRILVDCDRIRTVEMEGLLRHESLLARMG